MFIRLLCLSVLLVTLPTIAHSQETYITDKVLIDIYELQFNQGNLLKSLPSGTRVTVIAREGTHAKIRTRDNITGWVASKYLTNEKPTQLEYLQLVAKHKAAQDTIHDYENRLLEMQQLRKEASGADWLRKEIELGKNTEKRLENALHEKDAEIAQLQTAINGMQIDLDNANIQLKEVLQSMKIQSGDQADIRGFDNSGAMGFNGSMTIRSYTWLILSLMVTLVIGVLMGFVLIDYKIKKKHGDAPLY